MIGLNMSVSFTHADFPIFAKYGAHYSTEKDFLEDGDKISIHAIDKELGIDCSWDTYYHSPKTYAETFKKVGFVDFKWVPFKVSEDAPEKEYFDDLLAHPYSTAFSAVKPLE